MESSRVYFYTLDGFRGIAAVSVLLFHTLGLYNLNHLIPHAYLAVDFFFLLSGLVVAHAYERRLLNGLSVWKFFNLRLIRLYPLILLGLSMGFVVFAAKLVATQRPISWDVSVALLCNILMVPSVVNLPGWNLFFPFNVPSWSLFYELAANLAFALISTRLSNRLLLAILALTGPLLLVLAQLNGSMDFGSGWRHYFLGLCFGFGRVAFSFFVGIFLFRSLKNRKPFFPTQSRINANAIRIILVAVLLGSFSFPTPNLNWLAESAIVITVYPVIIFAACVLDLQEAHRTKFTAAYLLLGRISYPLYISITLFSGSSHDSSM